jgi:hypothetical protein
MARLRPWGKTSVMSRSLSARVRAPHRRYGAKDLVSVYLRAKHRVGSYVRPSRRSSSMERLRGPLRETAAPESLALVAVPTLRHYRRGEVHRSPLVANDVGRLQAL